MAHLVHTGAECLEGIRAHAMARYVGPGFAILGARVPHTNRPHTAVQCPAGPATLTDGPYTGIPADSPEFPTNLLAPD